MANTSIGTEANQIPINAYLGKLAYSDVIDTTDILDYADTANVIFSTANSALIIANAAYNKANTSGTGSGLVPTDIKTANGYIAIANDLIRCNTAAGAFSVSFPASPIDGSMIGVIDVGGTFGINTLTLLPNGNTIENDAFSIVLDISGSYASFIYNSATSNWKLLETPQGSGLTSTEIKISSYTAVVNDVVRCNTAAGAFSVTLPASPADGSLISIVDITGTFYTNNLTVNRSGSDTIENDTSLILDINSTYAGLMYNSLNSNWKLLQTPMAVLSLPQKLSILNRNGLNTTIVNIFAGVVPILTRSGSTIQIGLT